MFVERWRPVRHRVSRLLRLALVLGAAWLLSGLAALFPATAPAYAQTTSSTSGMTTQRGSTTVNVKNATGSVMRQDVFARGPNNTLAHRWRTVGTHPWTPWKLLDLHLESAPAVIQDLRQPNLIDVFYNTQANSDHSSSIERIQVDLNGNMVFHENLYSPECEHSFGGFCTPKHLGIISAPAVVSRSPDTITTILEVFALEDSHTMVHRWLTQRQELFGNITSTWSDWKVLSVANYVGDPAAISLGPNRMDVL